MAGNNWAAGTGQGWSGGGSSVGVGDILTALKILNQNMSQLIQTIQGITGTAGGNGTFQLTAGPSTTVPSITVSSASKIVLVPTNAAAAALQGSAAAVFASAIVAGTNFKVTTANNSNAAGTETFAYSIINPS